MYPNYIEPLRMRVNADWFEAAWLVRIVAVVGEGVEEVLVAVTGMVSVQSQVGPLHEYVRHILPCGAVEDVGW